MGEMGKAFGILMACVLTLCVKGGGGVGGGVTPAMPQGLAVRHRVPARWCVWG